MDDPQAMYDTGRMVVDRDGLQTAEPWFRMAADAGHFWGRRLFRPGGAFYKKPERYE